MKSITYGCIKCDCRVTVERLLQAPIEQPPYVRCPLCGVACVPETHLEKMQDANGNRDWKAAFRWSRCPSAYQCELYDQYDASCEDGQMMPKCLVSAHKRIEAAELNIPALAQPQRSARLKIRARGKSGQKTGS